MVVFLVFSSVCSVLLLFFVGQNYGERFLAQLLAGVIMIAIGGVGSFLVYFILHIIPIAPFAKLLDK